MSKHWTSLDGMRGSLAMLVVLGHFGLAGFATRHFGLWKLQLGLAVDVFFILSGFVLTHGARAPLSIRRFAIKRCFRLLPVYYVTTLIVVVAAGLPPQPWAELLVAGPFTGREPANFPAWSICWELYLPVLAVALAGLLPQVRLPQWLVRSLLVVGLLTLGVIDIGVARGEQSYLARAVVGLASGHLLYRSGWTIARGYDVLALAVVGVIIVAGGMPVLALGLPGMAAAAVVAGRRSDGLFTTRPMHWLGAVSYTIYLAHIPVLRVMQALFGGLIDHNAPAKLAGVAVTLVLADLLSRLVERPAMRLGARLTRH